MANTAASGSGARVGGQATSKCRDHIPPARAPSHPLSAIGRLAFAGVRIVTAADGTYRRDRDGLPAATLAVRDRYGELCDFLAWIPPARSPWWLLHGGETPILGARALALAAYFGDTVRLYSTPEAWAVAGGDDVVILKWDVDCGELFEGVARVECDCPELQQRLRQMLRRWEPTLVTVREVSHAA